jgi:hypothetical protein
LEAGMQNEGIKSGDKYRNKKTCKIYAVLSTAYAAWDSCQRLVVYQKMEINADDNRVWVRSLTEFNEKFELLG